MERMSLGSVGRSPWSRDSCERCGVAEEGLTKVKRICARCRRSDYLLDLYGLTADDVDALIAATGHQCPLCERTTDRWAVDHDHSCCPGKRSCGACVRGVLCHDCNRGLGMFQDSPDALRRAASYLEHRGRA